VLKTYRDQSVEWHSGKPTPAGVFWIDLVNPTNQERLIVEKATGLLIPSEEALSEIEVSSRLVFDRAPQNN
jgi:magnesium transporter